MPPREIVHLPFEAAPYRMSMDLTAPPVSELVELDDRYASDMAEKRRLLATMRDEVLIAQPGSEAASAETLSRLAEHLPARYPDIFSRDGDMLANRITGEAWNLAEPPLDPLEVAGRLVQEDLCLIDPTEAGPVLMAGVVCFPSRWRLADKIGKLLPSVHEHVPIYAERLARPVDRFMAHVKPGKLAVRLNWSILDDPALFQQGGKFCDDADAAITPDNAAEKLFLRVERQSLSLLPASGAVMFGIRVHVYPLAAITARPEIAARLAGAVRQLPPEIALYKSLIPFREALLAHLDARTKCKRL
jgi:hypothetical protein